MENIVSEGGDCFLKKKNYLSKSGGERGGTETETETQEGIEPTVTFTSPTASGAADHQIYRRNSSRSRSTAQSSSGSSRLRRRMNTMSKLCASHGSVSLCGRRREMEDVVTVQPDFVVIPSSPTAEIEIENDNQIERFDCYGVYDGHGGSRVAQLCSDRLHQVLAIEIQEMIMSAAGGGGAVVEWNWEEVMKTSFRKMDEEIDGIGIEEEIAAGTVKTVGSTAVVAVLNKDKLVVANCGDSRAVLYRGGVALPLSTDHKPERPDEMERVEAAGGRVINWNGYRVLGVLATSRSIGDHYLKPYVIAEPEVIVMKREPTDEFMILASDGLWDVMSNEIACDVVKKCLDGRMLRRLSANVERNNAGEAAAVLAELAMARGSKDNISIIVVELNQSSRNLI